MLGSTDRGASIAAGRHRVRKPPGQRGAPGGVLMRVRGLSSPRKPHDVSFDLRRGEILGIAGLVGSGRTELLRALAGLDEQATGTVEIGGSDRVPRSVRAARRRGIALLPEDRKGQGLVLPRSAADNVTLGEWEGLSRLSFLSRRQVERDAAVSATSVGFAASRIGEPTSSFSGGNQQKLLLARCLHTRHEVLLADEPTRGVDIGAKAEILVALEQLVSADRSLIVVSSEMEEVVGLSDRVLVIHAGRVVALLDSAQAEITVEQILHLIFQSGSTEVPEEE
jgi:ABC-type sugar transport system ATPase subunit